MNVFIPTSTGNMCLTRFINGKREAFKMCYITNFCFVINVHSLKLEQIFFSTPVVASIFHSTINTTAYILWYSKHFRITMISVGTDVSDKKLK